MSYKHVYTGDLLQDGVQKLFDNCELEEFFALIKHVTIYEVLSFASVATGAVTVPTQGIVDTGHFGEPFRVIVSQVSGGEPVNTPAYGASTQILSATIDAAGNILLSESYTGDLAIIWGFDITYRDYGTLTADELDRIIDETGVKAGDKHFTFTQGVASTSWVINHNLNKFPSAVIVDSGGTEVEGSITHTDANNLTITFNAPFTGSAYLN